jgi:EXLDI family protein
MPNKTIYVSDDDMPLYRRAPELAGGNLSGAIVTALRHYVEMEEGRRQGFEEITVSVGTGAGRKVRFAGVLLAEWGQSSAKKTEIYHVYRTAKGKFAVHIERTGVWDMEGGWRGLIGLGPLTWRDAEDEATLEVADTLDELRELIPPQLFDMVKAAAKQPAVEDLDI